MILTDAVKEDDIGTMQEIGRAARVFIPGLLVTAIEDRASDAMMDHLVKSLPSFYTCMEAGGDKLRLRRITKLGPIFMAAVNQKDPRIFHKLELSLLAVSSEGDQTKDKILGLIAQSRSPDLVQSVWRDVSPIHVDDFLSRLIPFRPDPRQELMAVECLQRVGVSSFSRETATSMLQCLGPRCCSVMIAEILLEGGNANVDGSGGTKHSPLFAAAGQTTQEAANLMKFLIMKGANTEVSNSKKGGDFEAGHLKLRPGPKNIDSWFGGTWEEMIKQWAPVSEIEEF